MRRILKWLIYAVLLLAGCLGLLIGGSYLAARHEPEFYREALQAQPAQEAELGAQLEQAVLDMRHDAATGGQWQAVFTEEQLNGWLAADLPRKFPELLPADVEEPRVAIEENEARIACRYDNGQIATVISFALAINLTDEPNTLAVQISKLRAGMLPVPLRQFLEPITAAAHNSEVPLRWSQSDGNPVALVTIPVKRDEYPVEEVHIESIELRDGELWLTGRSVESSTPAVRTARRGA